MSRIVSLRFRDTPDDQEAARQILEGLRSIGLPPVVLRIKDNEIEIEEPNPVSIDEAQREAER